MKAIGPIDTTIGTDIQIDSESVSKLQDCILVLDTPDIKCKNETQPADTQIIQKLAL